MKIIGLLPGGYLLQVTEIEIAHALGFKGYEPQWANHPARSSRREGFPVGTQFSVSPRMSLVREIEAREARAKSGAAALREIADMIEKNLPMAVFLPDPPEPPPPGDND